MTTRHQAAVEGRGTELVPEQDGRVVVGAHVNAVVGVAIEDRLTTIARTLQGETEPRTLGQLKADIIADLPLDGSILDSGLGDSGLGDADGLPSTGAGSKATGVHPPSWPEGARA